MKSKAYNFSEINHVIRTRVYEAAGSPSFPPQTEVWGFDAEYRVPETKKSFVDALDKEWDKYKVRNDILPYKLEDNDCDDYGLHLVSCVRNWNAHLRSEGLAITAGLWVCYELKHAFNFYLWGRELKLVGIEPQDTWLKEINPTKEQLCGRNLFIL